MSTTLICLAILIIIFLTWSFVWLIQYCKHVIGTLIIGEIYYDWATFEQFQKKFKEYEAIGFKRGDDGSRQVYFKNRFGTYQARIDLKDEIWFGDSYMILYPWSWIRCRFWLRQYTVHKAKRVKGLWKN